MIMSEKHRFDLSSYPLPKNAQKTAGATKKILSDPASEMLFRASRGVLRVASKILRAALRIAHAKDQAFIDEPTLQAAIDEVGTT
jgi:Holliday junction resolvasome RuvABC ATP-dependent DNA helicase subunit